MELKDGREAQGRVSPASAGHSRRPKERNHPAFYNMIFSAAMMALVTYLLASSWYQFSYIFSSAVRTRQDPPTVAVKNGSYSGAYSAKYDQDFFLGMPYAQVPARFSIAEGLDSAWDDVRSATEYPKHCIGYGWDNSGYEMSEDCLYLNVIRPAGVSTEADLPVAVWIHGGGLFMGGSADKRYNLSFIVENSVQLGTPLIGVSLNYRLSAFGFIAGREVTDAGATNIGFRDQRLALQWIHENIAAFGGSPSKVTIFGESSGAESVTAQVFAYNGRDDGLFRGAMAQSGFGGMIPRYPGGFNATEAIQETYDRFVGNVSSCVSLVKSSRSLACLRGAPFEEINKALEVTRVGPWPPVLDGDFFADHHANQVAKGNFVRVPLLVGANTDEGSGFGAGKGPNGDGVSTDEEMRQALARIIPPQSAETTGKSVDRLIDELMYLYPNIQSVGIPNLRTWPYVITSNDSYARQSGLQSRRTGAFFGDLVMQYPRRRANIAWSKYGVPSYAYKFDVTVNGIPGNAGACHFQEVAFVFLNLHGDGYATNPFAGNGTYPKQAKALAKSISSAWVNFVVNLDPNGEPGLVADGGSWPIYDTAVGGGVGEGIVFSLDGSFTEMDDWRAEGMAWMSENALPVFGN